jgi:tail assembly chaperone
MEFELDKRKFRVKKLSAFEQLHLSRKVAPLLPPLAPLIMKISENAKKEVDGKLKGLLSTDILSFAELAEPFAEALADMKDQHAEQIFTLTLSSVEVQTSAAQNVWMPLWIPGSKMASEIDLNDAAKLLPIVVRVIVHNLGNFMDALLTSREEVETVSSGDGSPVRKTG